VLEHRANDQHGGADMDSITEKLCRKCKTVKNITEFRKRKSSNNRFGVEYDCIECENKRRALYRETHREKIKEYDKLYTHRPDKNKTKDNHYRLKYGITLDDYKVLYKNQNGKCVACGIDKDVLFVDHDHKTGRIRGLLCRDCNFALGHVRDNPSTLEKLIRYLKNS
jgi:hypothetical protein